MLAHVEDGRIVKIASDKTHPGSGGRVCSKGGFAHQIVHSPDRLKRPLLKRNGRFEEVGWDEALDVAADRLAAVRDRHGPDSLVLFRGHIPGPDVLDAYAQLFLALGSSQLTGAAHLCHIPSYLGFHLVYGLDPYPIGSALPDYDNARLIVVWGANPSRETRASKATETIPRARGQGTRLIVIDPVRTDIAAIADEWLPVRPGTDLALGLAILHTVIRESLCEREFVERWCVGFDALASHVEPATPEWAEQQTGIAADQIRRVARVIATTKPMLIDSGNGLDMHARSVDSARMVAMLMALTGNLDVPGGNCFLSHPPLARYPTLEPRGRPIAAAQYPLFPGAAFPAVTDAMRSDAPGAPRAMLVYHGNPLLSNANERSMRQALGKLEFLLVSEMFMTATAELADLVLPDTSPLERLGFKSHVGPDGGYLSLRRPVVEPVWESRPWYDVERALAERLGVVGQYPWKTGREWLAFRIAPSGVSLAELESRGCVRVTGPVKHRKYLEQGFKTPSGKVELYSERLEELGLEPLPTYHPPPESAEVKPELARRYPLIGTTRRPGIYIHTRYRNIPELRKREPHASVRIHPRDAEPRGVGDGEDVLVESREGQIRVKSVVTTDTQAGVVVVDFGWGNPGDDGENVNRLTSDDSRDPVCSSTPNRRFLCEVRRVG